MTDESKIDGQCAILDANVKFDPINGNHIPNRSALTPLKFARAIALGDVNRCGVCGVRTVFSITNNAFNKACCHEHTCQLRRENLAAGWAAKDASAVAAINTKIQSTMMARYGVKTAGFLPSRMAAVKAKFGGPSPFSSPAVRAKSKATNIALYGGNPMTNDAVKDRAFSSRRANRPDVPFNAQPITPEKTVAVVDAVRSGESIPDVSKRYDVGIQAIYRLLHKTAPEIVDTQSPSLIERQMYDAIHGRFPDLEIICNTRSIIAPKEIDIYIPSLSLGIEVRGRMPDWRRRIRSGDGRQQLDGHGEPLCLHAIPREPDPTTAGYSRRTPAARLVGTVEAYRSRVFAGVPSMINIDSNYTLRLDPDDIKSSFRIQRPQNMSIAFYGTDGSTIGTLKVVDGKLDFSGDANDCASVFFDALHVTWLDRVWLPMDTAPHDTEIVVWCDGVQDLPPMVSLCKWHPDAGFCVDELREPKWWTNKPMGI